MQYTILVVDDEDGMLKILRILFERANYNVLVADDGDMALEIIRRERPDVVLMDDMMPGTSGTQICKIVTHDPSTAQIPVVIYSAGPDIMDQQYVREIGASAVIRKPAPPQKIVGEVQRALQMGV